LAQPFEWPRFTRSPNAYPEAVHGGGGRAGLQPLQGGQGTAASAMVQRPLQARPIRGPGEEARSRRKESAIARSPVARAAVEGPAGPIALRASRASKGGAVACHTSSAGKLQQWPDQVGARQGIGPRGSSPSQMVGRSGEVAAGKGSAGWRRCPAQFRRRSCSPSQRTVGQVLTTTCTGPKGQADRESSCWPARLARNSPGLPAKDLFP